MNTVDPSASFHFSIADDGTVVASGEIDMVAGPAFEALVLPLVQVRPLVIDLSAVTFLDSSGLRVLLNLARLADLGESPLVLRSPAPEVDRLFELTGTGDRFTIER